MPSRWDSATCRWRRRVFHYPPPTLMFRNFRLPCAIELQPLSLTPLKMRKVEPKGQEKTPAALTRTGWLSTAELSPSAVPDDTNRRQGKNDPRWAAHPSRPA